MLLQIIAYNSGLNFPGQRCVSKRRDVGQKFRFFCIIFEKNVLFLLSQNVFKKLLLWQNVIIIITIFPKCKNNSYNYFGMSFVVLLLWQNVISILTILAKCRLTTYIMIECNYSHFAEFLPKCK